MPYSSPFEPELRRRGAVYGVVGEVNVPLHFGDPARELQVLRTDFAFIDLPWRGMIEVTGRDRVRFLHGMCTNDIKGLHPGQGCMAAIVNRQGKMVAEMIVGASLDRLYIEADRPLLQTIIDALSKFLVADDVKLEISPTVACGNFGRTAVDLSSLPPFHFIFPSTEDLIISKDPRLGVPGVVSWRVPKTDETLKASQLAGFEAYEALRIENGFPRWGADMGPDLLPMEAGLEPIAISYTKGCYIGQEVIQRVKTYSEPPRMLVQLALSGAEGLAFEGRPVAGARVLSGGAEIGTVTSVGNGLALAVVRKEHKTPGTRVEIEPGLPATVRALPWHDAA